MSDATILIFGCAVTFTAAAGAYIAIRAGFNSDEAPVRVPAPAPIRSVSRQRPPRGNRSKVA